MKKALRMGAVLFVVCILAACLSGCMSIQDRKARQAFWADAEYDAMDWQGEQYVFLCEDNGINVLAGRRPGQTISYMPIASWDYIYVTESDVPTLLASDFGELISVSAWHSFLTTMDGRIFCRASQYEAIQEMMEHGISDERYAYISYGESEKLRVLTEEETTVLEQIVTETMQTKKQILFDDEYDDSEDLFACELFRCAADVELGYYAEIDLIQNCDGFYLSCAVDDAWCEYQIPAKYTDTVVALFAQDL